MIMRKMTAMLMAVLLLMTAGLAAAETFQEGPLQPGDTGAAVTAMQQRLIELGYLEGEPSGVYDDETEAAVLSFQEQNDLLASGIADRITLEVLMSENALHAPKEPDWDWLAETALEDGDAYSRSNGAMAMATWMPATAVEFASAVGYAPQVIFNTDEYSAIRENGFVSARTNPLSTFAADVDTSSYAQLRRRILSGEAVPADSVRIEFTPSRRSVVVARATMSTTRFDGVAVRLPNVRNVMWSCSAWM